MKTIDPQIVEQLQRHARVHELDRIAREAITRWLHSDPEDFPADFDVEQVQAVFASRWLCFEPEIVSYPFVDTRFKLIYQGSEIGHYRLISMLDGRIEDDYFVLDVLPNP